MTGRTTGRPPRLARFLLQRLLHPEDRECALSDLDEEFEVHAERRGRREARRWYWGQVRSSAWPAMERRSMVRGVSAPMAPRNDTVPAAFEEIGPWSLRESPTWPLRLARIAAAIRAELGLAVRRALSRPIATSLSVVTLGVAIGAAAATWSVLSAVLLDPLPVRDPKGLFVVSTRVSAGPHRTLHFERQLYPFYAAIRNSSAFAGMAAGGLRTQPFEFNGRFASRSFFFASHDYFETLGVPMMLGREFAFDEDGRATPIVVVLAYRTWQSEFNADPAVVGRSVSVGGQAATIIGVAPRAFRGLELTEAPDVYMPLHAAGYFGDGMVNWFAEPDKDYSPTAWVRIVGRLHEGASPEQASQQLSAEAKHAVSLTNVATAALPEAARPDMVRFVALLGGAVGLLLVVGALSVGMLLLVRTEGRSDEFAVCLAMGASRIRLAGGIALEGLLLALGGAALALPFAALMHAVVRTFNLPGRVSLDLLDRSVDVHVLAAAIVASFAAAVAIAVVAGAFSFRARVADGLRARGGSTPRLRRRGTRTALVIVQTAVAVVLVAGAGLFARSLVEALSVNPGYDTTQLITGSINPGPAGYEASRAELLFDDFRTALLQRPSVRSVTFKSFRVGMGPGGNLRIDGVRRAVPSMTEFRVVDDRYFTTVGLRVRRGRDFGPQDVSGSPFAGIVSESLGRFVADGGDPIGHTIAEPFTSGPGKPPNEIQIIGVVSDVVENISQLEPFVLYQPVAQRAFSPAGLVGRDVLIRSASRSDLAMKDAREALDRLDQRLSIEGLQTLDDALLQQMAPQHFGMLVLTALGTLAVLLTILGTAVLSESMAVLRRREMGIRAALGATGRELGWLVMLETVRLVGVGLMLGLVLSWLAADSIQAFLFRVRPLDPSTLVTVSVVMLLVALAVSLRPALRAARVDLASVLREE